MAEMTVQVWERPYQISVHQKSKTVWVAVGEYMGKTISVQDRTKGAAAKRWKEAARYRGNG